MGVGKFFVSGDGWCPTIEHKFPPVSVLWLKDAKLQFSKGVSFLGFSTAVEDL